MSSRARRRIPLDLDPNPLARLLAEARMRGRDVLDLTVTNPMEAGIGRIPREVLDALADPRAFTPPPDPRGWRTAREAAARYLGDRAGVSLHPDRVYLTSSTSEAYAHLFRLLCEPGDDVAVPCPSYPLLPPIASLESVRTHPYRLVYDGGWRLDLDSLEAVLGPRTRAIVLVEPNNPTGSCLAPEEHAAVEALCSERGIALIVDEVFGDFSWPPRSGVLPSRVGDRGVPTFVLGGVSKPCGLPQLKLGWIAACGPEKLVEPHRSGLEWILDLFLSVSAPVQHALPQVLEARKAYQSALAPRIAENLRRMDDAAGAGGGLERYRGDGGLSAVLQYHPGGNGPGPGEDLAEWALRTRDVYAHPAHFYDLDREDAMVVSLMTAPERMEDAIRRIQG